tara:strand:+ start:5923 stop:6999 length:1077 start_codon:yes stop_codon:yes gene_type:complete
MKKNIQRYNSEIDLIYVLKIIWDSKIKIIFITLISFLIGLGYNLQIPKNYLNVLDISVPTSMELQRVGYLNKLMEINSLEGNNEPNYENVFTNLSNTYLAKTLDYQNSPISQQILNMFINELKDYEEFFFYLKNIKKVEEAVSKFKIEDQEVELFKYASLLEVIEPKKDKKDYILNFIWHDPDEAKKILQDTLDFVQKNLQIRIVNELRQTLEFKKKFALNIDRERLNFLIEQSSIARELGILDNQIDSLNLSQSNVSLNINTANIAYYLRGYKAINKEIEIIKNRDYEVFEYIEKEISNFSDLDFELVNYNIYLMSSESLNNTKLILIIFIVLGLIIGSFYSLILDALKLKKTFKKN